MKTRACKSCRAALAPEAQPDEVRCPGCQSNFERWLKDEHPTVYRPRTDGLWRDIHGPKSE
jgi:phage FluMu protein Com